MTSCTLNTRINYNTVRLSKVEIADAIGRNLKHVMYKKIITNVGTKEGRKEGRKGKGRKKRKENEKEEGKS